jgi:hypothetical protein
MSRRNSNLTTKFLQDTICLWNFGLQLGSLEIALIEDDAHRVPARFSERFCKDG